MVASFSNFNDKTLFLRGIILKPTEKAYILLKNGTRGFQNSPRFERSAYFMWQSVKVSNFFNTLTLKQIFWKTKTFFKKLEYRFVVETTKIESTSFQFRLLCQKPMLRQTEWRLQNGPTSSYFNFLENLL